MQSFSNLYACTCSQWITTVLKSKEGREAMGRKYSCSLTPLDLCKYTQDREHMPWEVPEVSVSIVTVPAAFVSEAVLVCRTNHIAGFPHLASEPVSAFWGKVLNRGGGNSRISWRQNLNVSSGTSVCHACATLGSDNGLLYFQSIEPMHWPVQTSCVLGFVPLSDRSCIICQNYGYGWSCNSGSWCPKPVSI